MSKQDSNPYELMAVRDSVMRRMFDGLITIFEPDIVCDIGAMNGIESMRFSSLLPRGKIVAFEASPINYQEFFQSNPALRKRKNIIGEHFAVSDIDGSVEFNILDFSSTTEQWRRGANSMLDRNDGLSQKRYTVPSIRLDTYFKDQLDNKTFMLWIDVEGVVEKVVDGGNRVLERTLAMRIEVEQVEYWRNQKLAFEIKKKLEGMSFVELADTYAPHGHLQSDKLFVNAHILDLLSRVPTRSLPRFLVKNA